MSIIIGCGCWGTIKSNNSHLAATSLEHPRLLSASCPSVESNPRAGDRLAAQVRDTPEVENVDYCDFVLATLPRLSCWV
ncbi:hypothetical protein N7491_005642 [Penicillium cf. griseofulvum]|uniref:Uncharacterized protein n=1 Tax=Penicillium cf. griseofulvum TaxID=2972120 RepID=A0A9W9J2A2_9EURO|nr:hypothetical protein N7472_008328 [Penicillium cf. griseofulvum]KAJ5435047.1 hypothetical protein N7491_005642 [Penicillium cf. griseofulvum]KAJ5452881.1 hypothetical protein N7445_001064 [Penicillium cf. griseofulvum]